MASRGCARPEFRSTAVWIDAKAYPMSAGQVLAPKGVGSLKPQDTGPERSDSRSAHHHDLGADVHPLEQVSDVLVEHADAAIRGELADRLRLVGAVDGVLAPREGHGRNPHRVVGRATGDHVRQRRVVRLDLSRRRPRRLHIRRAEAEQVVGLLRQPAIPVAEGVTEAAVLHLRSLVARLRLANRDFYQAERKLDELCATLRESPAGAGAAPPDATVLRSLPGVGTVTLATLLTE